MLNVISSIKSFDVVSFLAFLIFKQIVQAIIIQREGVRSKLLFFFVAYLADEALTFDAINTINLLVFRLLASFRGLCGNSKKILKRTNCNVSVGVFFQNL